MREYVSCRVFLVDDVSGGNLNIGVRKAVIGWGVGIVVTVSVDVITRRELDFNVRRAATDDGV